MTKIKASFRPHERLKDPLEFRRATIGVVRLPTKCSWSTQSRTGETMRAWDFAVA